MRSILISLLLACPLFGQAVVVETDVTKVNGLLAAPPAIHKGRAILDGDDLRVSNGTAWLNLAVDAEQKTTSEITTLAADTKNIGKQYIDTADNNRIKVISALNTIETISVQSLVNNFIEVRLPGQAPVKYDVGVTEVEARSAFLAAEATLIDGSVIKMPPMREFVIPDTTVAGSRIVFEGNWSYFKPQNPVGSNEVLRFIGHGAVVTNVRGDANGATGKGRFLVATGDDNLINGVMCFGTDLAATAGSSIHTDGSRVTVTNVYTYQQNGSILHDGGTYSLRNAIIEDFGEPHGVSLNTDRPNANFSFSNVTGVNRGRDPNNGWMHFNPLLPDDERLGVISYDNCHCDRTVMNNTLTVSTWKVPPCRSLTMRNCTMDFADFSGDANVSANASTNTFAYTSGTVYLLHDEVEVNGTPPSPLVSGTTYHVINPTSTTFQLSATSGGAAIDLTDAGASVTIDRTSSTAGVHSVVIAANTPANTDPYQIDDMRIETSHLEGTWSGGGQVIRNLTLQGSTFDVRSGLQGNWNQSSTVDYTTIKNCRFLGTDTYWFGYLVSPKDFVIKNSLFSGGGVFQLAMVGDLANYRFTNVTLDQAESTVWVLGSPNTSTMMAMKKKGTYDQFLITGANTFPGTFSSGVSLAQGARLINKTPDAAQSFFDYGWNGSQWIAITGGGGSTVNNVRTLTTSGNILTTDDFIVLDGSSNAVTGTLPDAIANSGKVITIKAISVANPTQLATSSGQFIDSATTYGLTSQNEHVSIQSDGSQWQIISSSQALTQASVVEKGTGIQSQTDVINSYATQADIGPAPTAAIGKAYYTYDRATTTLNAFIGVDTDPGAPVVPGWSSVGSSSITTTYYEDLSDRPSPVTFVVGSQAVIFNDVGTPANNGTYTATGAAAGNLATTWTKN